MTLEKRNTSCLTMANNANEEAYPLKTTFDNCIIDGSFAAGKEEYKGELNLSVDDATPFEYLFNHCVVKTNGSNNDHFKEVLFTNVSPSYRLKGGEKNKYRFDFRPDSLTTLGVGKSRYLRYAAISGGPLRYQPPDKRRSRYRSLRIRTERR